MNYRLHYLVLPVLWIMMMFSWSFSYGQTTLILGDYSYEFEPEQLVDSNCDKQLDLTTNQNSLVDFPKINSTDPGEVVTSVNITSVKINGVVVAFTPPFLMATAGDVVLVAFDFTTNIGGGATDVPITYYVRDKIAPTFVNPPADITYTCVHDVPNANGNFYVDPGTPVQATDNCSSLSAMPPTINVVFTQIEPDGFPTQCSGGEFTRRWIATDDAGNKDTIFQTITVLADVTAPNVGAIDTLPTDTSFCFVADTMTMDSIETILGVMITDDCSTSLTMTHDDIASGLSCPVLWIRTYTFTDDCGNATDIKQKIIVNDTVKPEIILPVPDAASDCSLPMSSKDQFYAWVQGIKVNAPLYAKDSCDLNVTANTGGSVLTTLPDGCANGSYDVEFVFEDACGNVVKDTATYTISDNAGPVVGMARDSVISTCDPVKINSALSTWLGAFGYSTGSDGCSGIWTKTYKINGVTLDATGVGNALNASLNNSICRDTLGVFSVSGLVDVEFVYMDSCMNTSSTFGVFMVRDIFGPEFTTVPQDMKVECDGAGNLVELNNWLSNNGNGVATDSCSAVTWSNVQISSVNGCGMTDTLTYQFVVSDKCGNSNSASAKFIIEDTTGPNITVAPIDTMFQCDGAGNGAQIGMWLNSNGNGTATDDCGGVLSPWANNYTGLSDDCGATGSAVVQFTVEDACGNQTSVSATVGIIDTVPPIIITMAQDTTTECDGSGNMAELNAWLANNGGATASDLCSGPNVIWTNNFTSLSDMCGQTGIANVTFTASDSCGNQVMTMATFKIEDTTAPTFSVLGNDITVECDGAGNMADFNNWIDSNAGATAVDDCGGVSMDTTFVSETLNCGNTKVLKYRFTATDDCGNQNSFEKDFTIVDTTPPVFANVPADITIDCDMSVPIPSGLMGVTATDLCDGVSVAVITNQIFVAGACPIIGVYTNSWTATDACGNSNTALQTITVQDITAPVITGATDMMEPCDGGNADNQPKLDSWIGANAGATATDACDAGPTWSFSYETSEGVTGMGSTPAFYPSITAGVCNWAVTVTFEASDACGNKSTTEAAFRLTDNTAPSFATFPMDTVTVFADNVCAFDTLATPASIGLPTVTDNCDANLSLNYEDTGDTNAACVNDTIIRTWTVADHCGNSTVKKQVIFLIDNTAPTFTVPVDVTVDCDLGVDPAVTGMVVVAADNCGQTINTYVDSSMMTSCSAYAGTFDRHWTVSDACGNTSIGVQVITVQDTTKPVLTPTMAMDYNCSTATVGMNAAFTAWINNHAGATATDNCTPADDITWVAYDHGTMNPAALLTGMCPGDISQEVDFIATDACGNSTMTTETFKVTDDTAPVFESCLEDVTITTSSDGLGDCAANYTFMPPIIKDDCGVDISPCTPAYIPGGFVAVTSSGPGDPNVLVDPVTVTFVVAGPPTTSNGLVTVVLDLYNVDGEANDPTSKEYFNIFGEDGTQLGTTNKPQNQCGNASTTFTIDRTTFNDWAIDGLIEITLKPFNPGPGLEYQGINDICGSTTVGGSITYECSQITNLTLEYSLDGGTTRTPVPNPISSMITENFPIGTNTLTFIATDCSGNENTCSFNVTVEDDEPPVIANCTLSTLPATLATTDCNPVDLELPRPGGISDNCYINSYDQTVNAGLVTFTEHPNIDGYVIDTMHITFPMTIPPPATGMATLTVNFKGDIDNTPISGNPARELFEIIGEDGVSLGLTIAGPGCDPNMSVISVANITMTKLIDWSADGQIDLTIYPSNNNTFFGNDGDWKNDDYGVNPCGGVLDTLDGIGKVVSDMGKTAMSMRLEYTATSVFYAVMGATTIASTEFPTNGTNPTVNINPGPNTITYYVADVYGNMDSTCTTTVTVGSPSLGIPVIGAITANSCIGELDTLIETSNYVGTNPNWLWYEDVAPLNVNNGEDVLLETTQIPYKTYEITENVQNIYVIIQDNLCVSDKSGNANIPAGMNVIQPIVYINPNPICSGSDFGIYVDNPQLDWVSYEWSGPNGYTGTGSTPAGVNNATPVNSGEYVLTVTNTNGCELTGSANVVVKAISTATVTSISYDSGGTGPCVSGTDDLTFAITESPVDVNNTYTYVWSGPNGYSSTEKNAKVLNVTTADNGQYCVTVFDETGCPSVQKCIIVDVKDIPTTPVITLEGASTELCEGEVVTINATTYSGSNDIVYYWSTPIGTISTTNSSLIVDPVSANNAGDYAVFVSIDGCDSGLSNTINVTVKPRPNKPTITGVSPICSGDSLVLETPAIQGATYEWSGPGLTASVNKVVIYPATSINAGDYSVRISIDGCPSDFSDLFTVTIDPTPATPVASASGNVCLDDNNATLSLNVDNVTSGASYEWFNADGNVSIGTTSQAEYTITNLNVFNNGTYNFYVVATMPTGCASAISNIVSVEMNNIPNISAFAGDDINVCGSGSVNLAADMPTQGTGLWTQVSGPTATIADMSSPTTTVNGLLDNSEYEFAWTLSNGACTDFSSDIVKVVVNNSDGVADAGVNQDLCDASTATITAVAAPTGSIGTWSQSAVQSALGAVIINPSNPTTDVTGLVSGNDYIFTWTLSNKGCGDYSTDAVTITVFEKVNASLTQDVNICGDVTVSANNPGDCTGVWSSSNPDIVFADPSAQVTEVTGLAIGENILRWTITCGNCGETYDEMIVSYEGNTIAEDDVEIVDFVNSTTFDAGANDQFYAGATFSVVSSVSKGTLTNDGDGMFTYLPDVTTDGTDEFTYEVCSVNCPNECDQAKVTIAVSIDTDCSIPTIITPNGDGYNDEFLIACLKATSKYPNNKVTIFNEWGDQVFEASPYQNDWKGTYNGQELPVGTYFYIVDFGDGSDPQSGFLLIER